MRHFLFEHIRLHQQMKAHPYMDDDERLKIGYGRNIEERGISQAEAETLLQNDILESEADLKIIFGHVWDYLAPARKLALADLRFILGPACFRSHAEFIDMIKKQQFNAAAADLRKGIWPPGDESVDDRRKSLMHLLLTTGEIGDRVIKYWDCKEKENK